MQEMSQSVYQTAICWVIDKIAMTLCIDATKEKRRQYAASFTDRVKKVLHEHAKDGCVESDFVPHFKLSEIDLVHYTLTAMTTRGIVKREVRYYIRPVK